MNKTFFIAMISFMMALTALLTSCSSDDTIEEIVQVTLSWVEPYCTMALHDIK
jgi:major membrane immunogen (membrane-anchored lipoprotein)